MLSFLSANKFVAKDHLRFLWSKPERTIRVFFNMSKFRHGSDEVSIHIDYLIKIIHLPM